MEEGEVCVLGKDMWWEGINSTFYSMKSMSKEHNFKNISISMYFKDIEVNTRRSV